jgi:dihydrofolate reductase
MSISLDGFVAGADDGPGNPLGDGGEQLHEWLYELESWRKPHGLEGGVGSAESEHYGKAFESTGAWVMGHRMYMNAEVPWGDDPPFHTDVYVVTHEQREPRVAGGGTTFYFVNDGVSAAIEAARASAGEQDVRVAGGANVVQQGLASGAIDELNLQIVPLLLGSGVPMFGGARLNGARFELIDQFQGAQVTHVRYRVIS